MNRQVITSPFAAWALRFCIVACASCAALIAISPAAGQPYPTKPIRLIVPFSPGGPADLLGRVIGEKLQRDLGQPVVILNKDGAGTILGADLAAKSTPDGYTMLLGSAAMVVNSSAGKNLPYDLLKDLAPVSIVFNQTQLLVIYPGLPFNTVKDLIAYAKVNPGKLKYGSSGVGSGIHLTSEVFRITVGIQAIHVPYKGVVQPLNDVVSGQIDMMFPGITPAVPYVKSGKLKALGVASRKRTQIFPDVPTLIEMGVNDFESSTGWYGVLVPAGTPKAVIARLNSEIVKIMALPDVMEKLGGQGGESMSSSPEKFAAYIRRELTKWTTVIKAANIHIE